MTTCKYIYPESGGQCDYLAVGEHGFCGTHPNPLVKRNDEMDACLRYHYQVKGMAPSGDQMESWLARAILTTADVRRMAESFRKENS